MNSLKIKLKKVRNKMNTSIFIITKYYGFQNKIIGIGMFNPGNKKCHMWAYYEVLNRNCNLLKILKHEKKKKIEIRASYTSTFTNNKDMTKG